MDWLQLVGIIAAVVVPVGLAIHRAGQARSDREARRLDQHVAEDVVDHERIARLEERIERNAEKIDRHDDELRLMRERYHNFRDDLTRYIGAKLDEAVATVRRVLGRDRSE